MARVDSSTFGENSGLVCRKVLPVASTGMLQGGTTCASVSSRKLRMLLMCAHSASVWQ